MPLILDDLDLTTSAADDDVIPATFFSSKFTGNGQRKSGLLGGQLTPTPSTNNGALLADAAAGVQVKSTSTQNGISVSAIPIAPMLARAYDMAEGSFTIAVPETDDLFEIETASADLDFRFFLTPQSAKLYEDTATGEKKLPREFIVQYRMEIYCSKKGQDLPERALLVSETLPAGLTPAEPVVSFRWSVDPMSEAEGFIGQYLSALGLVQLNTDALATWLTDTYNVHDNIVRQAEIWNSTAMADEIVHFIDGMPDEPSANTLNALVLQMRYLENYVVPLEAYGTIHQKITQTFDDDIEATLAKENLNLLMSHRLHQLDQIKGQLSAPPKPASYTPPAHLSNQQLAAICTHEPLVMTQAGAGTGKSTTILERISYLEACGVPASDITVLSFTNIAADNITAKNPNVGSMTIARMIHDIYALNHPTHELSSTDTIINSIEIFYPNSNFAHQFTTHLLNVDKNRIGAFTELNTFIERNYEQVMSLLDQIKQITLELEIIICYQQIDNMIEPPHVACRYLIIDEVQDNSIFEFVYLLKYVTKHRQSLFIVGDASQTLFEFRSANPRALNTLEGSGVFATYKLTTNYRSNQEILDFANVLLGGLKTNQIAQIQLQANSLEAPTADSFQEKVIVDYHQRNKVAGFTTDELAGILRGKICPKYVQAALDRGEQVAFLAFSRREVAIMEQTLREAFPNRHVANLVMERPYATDVFSKYIKFFWNDVLQVQPSAASFTVARGIKDNLHKLTNNAGNENVRRAVSKMVADWWLENSATVQGWEQLCMQGPMSHREFFEKLRDNMLSFEIHHNAVRQSLVQQKNRDRKEQNAEAEADLIVSTVHGAKGMEFDNVVIIHREEPNMSESVRRMYYVAFTRAKKTEYVLSYGKPVDPPIVSNHQLIVEALKRRDLKVKAQQLGISVDELIELEKEKAGSDEKALAGAA